MSKEKSFFFSPEKMKGKHTGMILCIWSRARERDLPDIQKNMEGYPIVGGTNGENWLHDAAHHAVTLSPSFEKGLPDARGLVVLEQTPLDNLIAWLKELCNSRESEVHQLCKTSAYDEDLLVATMRVRDRLYLTAAEIIRASYQGKAIEEELGVYRIFPVQGEGIKPLFEQSEKVESLLVTRARVLKGLAQKSGSVEAASVRLQLGKRFLLAANEWRALRRSPRYILPIPKELIAETHALFQIVEANLGPFLKKAKEHEHSYDISSSLSAATTIYLFSSLANQFYGNFSTLCSGEPFGEPASQS